MTPKSQQLTTKVYFSFILYVHCGLASALYHVVFTPGPRLMEQTLWGTLSWGRGKWTMTKHNLVLKASVPTSSTKQVVWPLPIPTERECETLLQGAAPHRGAANILSVNTICHPHFNGDLPWHHQVALEGAPCTEPKSQDITRFCQDSRDLLIFSAVLPTLSSAPLTLTGGTHFLETPSGESRCCSRSL